MHIAFEASIMLRAFNGPTIRRLTNTGAKLALSVSLFGCGKTPEGAANAAAGGTGNNNKGGQTSAAGATDAATGMASLTCQVTAGPGDMVSVPAGSFPMGCDADPDCKDDETPLHTVSVSAFEIDRTEVTQAEYSACVGDQACAAPACAWNCAKTDYPAHCLDRTQAVKYCEWAAKRLPTEAEWEFAARGSEGRKYPWGDTPPDCDHANMASCGGAPEAVGKLPDGASADGALDMAGNVVEMVADWYDDKYYAVSPAKDPMGPASGTRYVGRGGGFKSEAVWQRTSARDWYDTTDSSESLGFRCAR